MEIEYPETRLAKRLTARYSLRPPVDVLDIARKYAEVRIVQFPVNVDGVSVGLKQPGRKPTIYVNAAAGKRRRRFTLAHELGHVLIPWHVGSIVDELEIDESRERSRYWEMESEANRFAAELLMPDIWSHEILHANDHIHLAVEQIAEQANVSVDAAVLKALRLGPSGYTLVKSEGGEVAWSARTVGTMANRPPTRARVSKDLISPSISYGTNSSFGGSYHWWREAVEEAVPPAPADDWRTILNEILNDLELENAHKARQSINAMVAYGNGRARHNHTRERIYASCLQVIRNRDDHNPDLALVIDHPRFSDFLLARVYSFTL